MDAGATGAAKATGSWVLAIVDSVTAETPIAISRAMNDAIKAEHISEFVTPTFEALNHGMMLGALDGAYEADTNNTIDAAALSPPEVELSHRLASSTSTTYRVLGFSNMTYESALDQFLERKVLTRASFDALTEKARRRAFTIAGTSKIQIIKTAQRELARQVALGADLSNFRKVVAQRLESAGWTPASRSHVETIFRTNVANTYQAGHWEHRMRPSVLKARPFTQVVTVNDGPPRQRETHRKLHMRVLRADDPAWKEACPPFGYNCRCRLRTLPSSYDGPVDTGLPDVPDAGFTSGVPSLI
jgi:SPP1 gp7 family putative phage head morphogenesis protein